MPTTWQLETMHLVHMLSDACMKLCVFSFSFILRYWDVFDPRLNLGITATLTTNTLDPGVNHVLSCQLADIPYTVWSWHVLDPKVNLDMATTLTWHMLDPEVKHVLPHGWHPIQCCILTGAWPQGQPRYGYHFNSTYVWPWGQPCYHHYHFNFKCAWPRGQTCVIPITLPWGPPGPRLTIMTCMH